MIHVTNKVCQNTMNTEGLTISHTKYIKLLQAWIEVCIFSAKHLTRTLKSAEKTSLTSLSWLDLLTTPLFFKSSLKADPVSNWTHLHLWTKIPDIIIIIIPVQKNSEVSLSFYNTYKIGQLSLNWVAEHKNKSKSHNKKLLCSFCFMFVYKYIY